MPTIANGAVTMDMPWFIALLGTLIVVGGGFIGFLLKYALDLHREQATLKAKVSSLEERNTEAKDNFRDVVTSLKKHNLKLQEIVDTKCSGDAILSKYKLEESTGCAIQIATNKRYCSSCLYSSNPPVEVPLKDDDSRYWQCVVQPAHTFDKPGRQSLEVSAPDYGW